MLNRKIIVKKLNLYKIFKRNTKLSLRKAFSKKITKRVLERIFKGIVNKNYTKFLLRILTKVFIFCKIFFFANLH